MMTRARRILAAQAMLLSAVVLASRAEAAAPAVLEQVPDNAAVAVVAKDLRSISNKVSNLATRMHLPVNEDILTMLKKQMGVDKGLDETGSAAVVVLMPAQNADNAESGQPVVLLLPSNDPKALLEGYNPTPAGDGISTVTLPGPDAKDGYVATLGHFVAMAENKDALKTLMDHKGSLAAKLAPETEKVFEDNDVVAYLNFPTFAKRANTTVDQMAGFMNMALQQQQQAVSPLNAAMQQEMFSVTIDGLHHVLTDTQVGLITAGITDTGVTLGFQGHFTPDSPTAKFVAAQKPDTAPVMTGFAAGNILMAMGADWDRQSVADKFAQVADNVANNPELTKEQAADAAKMMASVKQLVGMVGGMKIALYEPADPSKGIITRGASIVTVTDSAQFLKTLVDVSKSGALASSGNMPGFKTDMTVDENATTVDGVELTKVTVKMTRDDTAAGANQQALNAAETAMKMMYGGSTISSYYGVLDGTHVVQVTSPDEAFIKTAIAAAKDKNTGLADELKTDHVVPGAFLVSYLPVDRWVSIGMQVAMARMGGQAPANAGGGAAIGGAPAPAVASVGAGTASGSAQLFLPTTMLVSIAERIQGMQQQMQGMQGQ